MGSREEKKEAGMKQINIWVDEEEYNEYKKLVEATNRNVTNFNDMIFRKGMQAEVKAFEALEDKPTLKLFSDLLK